MRTDNEEHNFQLTGEIIIYESQKYKFRVAYKVKPSNSNYGAYAKAIRIGHLNEDFTEEETFDHHESISKHESPYFQLLKDTYINKLSFIINSIIKYC